MIYCDSQGADTAAALADMAFSVAGPMFWNSLPRNLRDPSHTAAVFGRSPEKKHFFSQSTSVHSASEAFATMRYINWCFTYFTRYVLTQHSATIQRLWQSLCSLVKIVAKQTCPAPGVKVHRSSALVRLLSWLSLFLHVGLGSAAAWRHSTFIKWTGWTLAMALPWWQHHKHCLGYYYYYYCSITLSALD